jgi:hypothetical protein
MSSRMLNHEQLSGRRSERVATNVPALLLVNSESGQTSCQVHAIDKSQHGVRIQTSFFSLAPGQTVEVILMGDQRRSALGRVVWVRPSSSDRTLQLGLEILSS